MSSVLHSTTPSSAQNSQSPVLETPIDQKPVVVLRSSWTLGDSNALVDGRAQESKLVGLSWIVVPTLLALAVLYFMMPN